MLISAAELLNWLRVRALVLLLHLGSVETALVLYCFYEGGIWWPPHGLELTGAIKRDLMLIFLPLWVADALTVYFNMLVLSRTVLFRQLQKTLCQQNSLPTRNTNWMEVCTNQLYCFICILLYFLFKVFLWSQLVNHWNHYAAQTGTTQNVRYADLLTSQENLQIDWRSFYSAAFSLLLSLSATVLVSAGLPICNSPPE